MRSFDKSCPNLVQHKFQGYGLGCSGVDSTDKALYKSRPPHAHVMKPENFSVLDQELKNTVTEGLVRLCWLQRK